MGIKKFRNDINTLRAISIISVILFHFYPDFIPGGYIGVDVFFVISGFLMTGIITKKIEKNIFHYSCYFRDRCNRIIPPLAIMIMIMVILGWFILSPLDYYNLSEHAVSSLLFFSNFNYFFESGYFDVNSQQKWLLHTWSLSVEWQFYLLYPLLLIYSFKFFKSNTKYFILLLTVISFFITCFLSFRFPNASYFLLPTRAWELLLGGVAYFFPKRIKGLFSVYISLCIVVLSFFILPSDISWPNYYTIIPLFSVFVIIQNDDFSKMRVFNSNFIKNIGLWSYSIYLWHWPIAVFGFYFGINNWGGVGIPLSVLIGFISYSYLESKEKIKLINVRLLLLYMLTLSLSILMFLTHGGLFRYNVDKKIQYENLIESVNDWFYPRPNAKFDEKLILRKIPGGKSKDLYVGDSLMEQFYVSVLNKRVDNTSVFFTRGACTPFYNYNRKDRDCSKLRLVNSYIKNNKFDNIYITGYWGNYFSKFNENYANADKVMLKNEMIEFFKLASERSNHVFYILPMPYGKDFDPKNMINNYFYEGGFNKSIRVNDLYKVKEDFYNMMFEIAKESSVVLLDPIPSLCENNICNIIDITTMKPTNKDDIHGTSSYMSKVDISTFHKMVSLPILKE